MIQKIKYFVICSILKRTLVFIPSITIYSYILVINTHRMYLRDIYWILYNNTVQLTPLEPVWKWAGSAAGNQPRTSPCQRTACGTRGTWRGRWGGGLSACWSPGCPAGLGGRTFPPHCTHTGTCTGDTSQVLLLWDRTLTVLGKYS